MLASVVLDLVCGLSPANSWADAATAIIALLALFGAIVQLLSVRRATRRRTALGYYERWNDREAVSCIAEMTRLLAKSEPGEDDDRRWEEWWEKDLEPRLNSLLFVNFWEEMGGLYNRRLLDRKLIRQYFGRQIVYLWDGGRWFVERSRRRGPDEPDDPHIFDEWERMSDDIRRWLDRRDRPRWPTRAWRVLIQGEELTVLSETGPPPAVAPAPSRPVHPRR